MANSRSGNDLECNPASATERIPVAIVLGHRQGTERASQGYWARLLAIVDGLGYRLIATR